MKIWMYALNYDPDGSSSSDKFLQCMGSYLEDLKQYETDVPDRIRVLYAVTNDKEKAKLFEAMHDMKQFDKSKKKIDDNAWASLIKEEAFENAVLDFIDISVKSKASKKAATDRLLVTELEAQFMDDLQYDIETNIMRESSVMNYACFAPEFIPALDALLYCTSYKMSCDDTSQMEAADYNWSGFGITSEGYLNGANLKLNYFDVYVDTFEYILLK